MFLRSMTIYKTATDPPEVIRTLQFQKGVNLIVDDTPSEDVTKTGNNVGKTTVLKLVAVCLGKSPQIVYQSEENSRQRYELVSDFIVHERILVELRLARDLSDNEGSDLVLSCGLWPRGGRRINGKPYTADTYIKQLRALLFNDIPEEVKFPTFAQLVGHNVRYDDRAVNNPVCLFNAFTENTDYESLYLYMFGFRNLKAEDKRNLTVDLRQEKHVLDRLSRQGSKADLEFRLDSIKKRIEDLEVQRAAFDLDGKFGERLDMLSRLKEQVAAKSLHVNQIKARLELAEEAVAELDKSRSTIDMGALRSVYNQASSKMAGIQKTFQDLVDFHNKMVDSKIRFISKTIPPLEQTLQNESKERDYILDSERRLSSEIYKRGTPEDLQALVDNLTNLHHQQGEYENQIKIMETSEKEIEKMQTELSSLGFSLYSDEFQKGLKERIEMFNHSYLSDVSKALYGEDFLFGYNLQSDKKSGSRYYWFKIIPGTRGYSSGTMQGEVLCFDIAYTLFAEANGIPCLRFLLNDKKELMHGNQILQTAKYVEDKDVQVVFSMLKDKLPDGIEDHANIVVELSQDDKLFRIESSKKEY